MKRVKALNTVALIYQTSKHQSSGHLKCTSHYLYQSLDIFKVLYIKSKVLLHELSYVFCVYHIIFSFTLKMSEVAFSHSVMRCPGVCYCLTRETFQERRLNAESLSSKTGWLVRRLILNPLL